MKQKGDIDLTSDTIKALLMNDSFSFDNDTSAIKSGIIAFEVAAGNGYIQDDITLVFTTHTEDDTNDRARVAFSDILIVAAGGDIGPVAGLIFYDGTTSDDTVIGYLDFEGDETILDGKTLEIKNIYFDDE